MPPERIGKYRIDAKIGQGSMGDVWKAHDAVLNREVAIKTISTEAGGDDDLRKRFLREAQSAARLNHPNIITVYDFGDEDGVLFMAMELLSGNDLRTLILRKSISGLEQKLQIMEQACEGLAFAHSQDIVHRDIKPANIYIQPGGQVKIVDFGLARMSGSEMTRTGTVMGTPHYMSPEQVRGERADARSDVFSLGACFYELLTGKKPFEADSMHAVLFKVMQEEPEPVKDVAPEIPAVLSEVLIWAMAKDRDDRFQDAGALHEAIAQARVAIADGRGEEPLDDLQLHRRSSPQLLPAAGSSGSGERSRFGSRPGAGSKPGSRPGSGPGSGSRPGSGGRPSVSASGRTTLPSQVSVAVETRSRTPLFVAGGAAAALAVAGLLYSLRPVPAPSNPPASRPAQVDSLAQAVAGTEVELATRKLASGDYREAARRADRALRIDPSNADAKNLLEAAKKVVEASDQAAQAAKSAADPTQAAAAFFELVKLDPRHPEAGGLQAKLEQALDGKLAEARQAASDAQKAAESAGADKQAGFPEGVARSKDAEAAAKAGRSASAVRAFFEARDLFDRARKRSS